VLVLAAPAGDDVAQALTRMGCEVTQLTGADLIPAGGNGFAGKERETLLLFPRNLSCARLLLVGAGTHKNWSSERLRRGGATAAKAVRGMGLRTASFIEPEKDVTAPLATASGEDPAELYAHALAEGIFLGLYRYDKYKTRRSSAPEHLTKVSFITESPSGAAWFARGIARAAAVCEATCFARDLENSPGNEIYPESLAAAARSAGSEADSASKSSASGTYARSAWGALR